MIEQVERYWDSRPCNVAHSPAPVGTFEWSAEVFHRKYLIEPHILKFANFRHWANKQVLEIGCGIGTDTLNFARSGAFVTAVDISSESLNLARQRAILHGLSYRIHLIHADVESLSSHLPTNSYAAFSLIYSFGVLHHTPDPLRALQQLRLYCGPDTILKLMLYHKWSWKFLIARQQPEAQPGCPIVHLYSRSSARRLLEKAGFHVTRMQVAHIFQWDIPSYKHYQYRPAFPWNIIPASKLERYLGHHLLIDAVLQ
jgi:SAM-dependent methyltransferase